MSIRERIASAIGGAELRERQEALGRAVTTLVNAYDAGKYELPPTELIRQLSEYTSSEDIDFIMSLVGWEGDQLIEVSLDNERAYAVKRSQHGWRHNPGYQWSVWSWTNWGMGEGVDVTLMDESARELFNEYWTATRNRAVLGQDCIAELSNQLLVTGDRYLVHFASTVDGQVTTRSIPPDQFPEKPVTDPQDGSTPLFYKRKFRQAGKDVTLYYPDWAVYFTDPERLNQEGLLPTGAKRADQPNGERIGDEPGTVAVIQHIAFNRKDEADLRGWPLGTVSLPYHRAHRRFVEDRLAVAAAKAMFVRRKKVKSGSRGLAGIISTVQSGLVTSGYTETNPAAVAGSVEGDNEAVTTTDLPMTTGASDAKSDNEMFVHQAFLGDGLFSTTAGYDTSRWATAVTMDKNQAILWSRYRGLIRQMFQDMVTIVLSFSEQFGGGSYPDKSASVFIDILSLSDLPDLMDAFSTMFKSIVESVGAGIMPLDVARRLLAATWMMILQTLGVEGADEVASDEAFGVGDEGQPAPSQQTEAAMQQAAAEIAETARVIRGGYE